MWRTLYPWQAIRWDADGDGGAGGGSVDNQPQNPGNDDGDGTGGDGEIKLTSAQLAERLNRQKRVAINEFLSSLGFEKSDDLKTLVERARAADEADKTELQKAQEQLAEYQKREQVWAQEKRAQALQIAVQGAATKLGIVDPDVALALIQSSIEYDDAGQPKDVEKALNDLLAQKPYLKGTPSSGSPTNPPRGSSTTLTKEDIAKMSPEQINARWDEVSQVLESGR